MQPQGVLEHRSVTGWPGQCFKERSLQQAFDVDDEDKQRMTDDPRCQALAVAWTDQETRQTGLAMQPQIQADIRLFCRSTCTA